MRGTQAAGNKLLLGIVCILGLLPWCPRVTLEQILLGVCGCHFNAFLVVHRRRNRSNGGEPLCCASMPTRWLVRDCGCSERARSTRLGQCSMHAPGEVRPLRPSLPPSCSGEHICNDSSQMAVAF